MKTSREKCTVSLGSSALTKMRIRWPVAAEEQAALKHVGLQQEADPEGVRRTASNLVQV